MLPTSTSTRGAPPRHGRTFKRAVALVLVPGILLGVAGAVGVLSELPNLAILLVGLLSVVAIGVETWSQKKGRRTVPFVAIALITFAIQLAILVLAAQFRSKSSTSVGHVVVIGDDGARANAPLDNENGGDESATVKVTLHPGWPAPTLDPEFYLNPNGRVGASPQVAPSYQPPISVILASHNEHVYLQRTLDSIVNSTSRAVLREIIVVDDASSPPMENDYDPKKFPEGLVKFVRNEERQGLIRSKVIGGDTAKGSVLVFLDAHVKPDPGWALPILKHLNQNYKRVVVPEIPVLNGDTWVTNRHAVGIKMMFDWDMSFHWFEDRTDWVPCMSGGLLAITTKWWHESGTLDDGMYMWGGENIEQSIRIWLCGGEIVVARDSVIAHVFRPKFPYSIDGSKVLTNKVRTVETWFDEWKERFYDAYPSARRYRPRVEGNNSKEVKPRNSAFDIGDLSGRRELQKRLKCRPFDWYVQRFREVFMDRNMMPIDSFLLQTEKDSCVVPTDDKDVFVLRPIACDADDPHQRWTWRNNGSSIQHIVSELCLDAAIGKAAPELRQFPSKPGSRSVDFRHAFEAYPCMLDNRNQLGWRLEDERLTHGSLCAELEEEVPDEEGAPRGRIRLAPCGSKHILGSEERDLQRFVAAYPKELQPSVYKSLREEKKKSKKTKKTSNKGRRKKNKV